MTDHKKALDDAISQIEKQFGKGAIMRLGAGEIQKIEVIPTGAISLDLALGVGGVPRGRMVEIYGPDASGKTTLALHIVAQAQKMGEAAAYIDAEHTLDPAYAKNLGVDIENLLIAQPDTGEEALEIADILVQSGEFGVLVIDSVAALVPRAEIEGEMGDSHIGLQARLMSQAMRKLAGAVHRSGTTILFINQLREKVGVMFGSPEVTSGGKALKYYASVRIDLRRIESIKEGTVVVGNKTRAKIVKNKVAPPFREAEFDIVFGEGISREGCLVDAALKADIIRKGGAWYTYNGDQLGQGRENAKRTLRENPELAKAIEEKLLESVGPVLIAPNGEETLDAEETI